MPTPPANIELVPWDNRTSNPAIFTVHATKFTPLAGNKQQEERTIYRPAVASDTAAVKRAGFRWARIRRTIANPPAPPPPKPAAVNILPPPPAPTVVPTPPANLELVEWNARTTNEAIFRVHSKTTVPIAGNRIKENRVIWRPPDPSDSPAVKAAGRRWARIERSYPDPNYVPPPKPTPPPKPPAPVYQAPTVPAFTANPTPPPAPPPPDFSTVLGTPPAFNQGLANAITNLVPSTYQNAVGAVLTSVLGTGPTTAPVVVNTGGPIISDPGTTGGLPTPPGGVNPPDETPAIDPNIRNAIVLIVGVGAVYYFFLR